MHTGCVNRSRHAERVWTNEFEVRKETGGGAAGGGGDCKLGTGELNRIGEWVGTEGGGEVEEFE